MKLLYLLIFLSINLAYAGDAASLFKQNPIPKPTTSGNAGSVVASLSAGCQKLKGNGLYQSAVNLIPQYVTATSPVMPYVGFAVGSSSHKSMLMNLCELFIGIDSASTQGIILQTGAFLNDLSGNKFDDAYNLADKSFNLANSIYDFDNGKYRVGAMTNASTHQKIVDEMNAMTKLYQKRVNNKDVEGMETKSQRKNELARLSQASYQRAVLKEATNCPAPSGTTDFLTKYSNYVLPKKSIIEDEKINTSFYYDMLMKMGPDFLVEVVDVSEFSNSLNQIMHWSFSYIQAQQYFEQKDSQLTGYLDRDGKPERKDQKVRKKINVYTTRFNDQNLSSFKKKYVKMWESWVKSQYLTTGTFGFLSDKKGRIEEKYRSYAFECSERNIIKSQSLSKDDSEYNKKIAVAAQQCFENLKIRENDVKNIMELYIEKLIASLKNQKKAEVDIWNFEAQNLGYNRDVANVTKPGNPKEYSQTEVVCSNTLEPSELGKLSMKTNAVNLSLKEQWMQADSKELMMEEERAKAESAGLKDTYDNNDATLTKVRNGKATSTTAPIMYIGRKGGL